MVREGSASSLFDQGLSIFVVRGSCTRNRLDQELAISFGPPLPARPVGESGVGGRSSSLMACLGDCKSGIPRHDTLTPALLNMWGSMDQSVLRNTYEEKYANANLQKGEIRKCSAYEDNL